MPRPLSPSDIRQIIETAVEAYPDQAGLRNIWRTPLSVTAKAGRRFEALHDWVAPDHLLPRDLLPSAKTVIVFFIPFVEELARENDPGKFPCRNWGLAYEATNRLIDSICEELQAVLAQKGFRTKTTPPTHNFDPERLISRWSHKHLAHLTGLGRFGVNAQMITSAGCAGRLGSLVTDAELGDSPLVTGEELCLHKLGKECLQCMKRCPVEAVGMQGINRRRCWERLIFNLERGKTLAGLDEETHVCAKCQVLVPCSLSIPTPVENPGN
jgi:epoxyqueuosine reductase QueG